MKHKGVIFDLGGTLIYNFPVREGIKVLEQVASVFSVSSDDFIKLFYSTYNDGVLGVLKDTGTIIEYICEKLGIHPVNTQAKLATQILFDYVKRSMIPLPDATEVLSHLKSSGYKIGLITNCTDDVVKVWQNMPFAPLFDITVFSCIVGMKKPDPRIYQIAMEQLRIEPQSCLYIGNGDNQELTGAAQVGMYPVLIRIPDEANIDVYRRNNEGDKWDGPIITSLRDVITLVEAPKNNH